MVRCGIIYTNDYFTLQRCGKGKGSRPFVCMDDYVFLIIVKQKYRQNQLQPLPDLARSSWCKETKGRLYMYIRMVDVSKEWSMLGCDLK